MAFGVAATHEYIRRFHFYILYIFIQISIIFVVLFNAKEIAIRHGNFHIDLQIGK